MPNKLLYLSMALSSGIGIAIMREFDPEWICIYIMLALVPMLFYCLFKDYGGEKI